MPVQTERECTASANANANSSPADWVTVNSASAVTAVAKLHDNEYITADSIGQEHWFDVGGTGSDTTQTISKVGVTICARRHEPDILASVDSLMRVPSHDTLGYTGKVFAVKCDFSCQTTYYYTPEPWNTKSPPAWTWSDINDLEVGVKLSEGLAGGGGVPGTQGYPTDGAADVGRVYVTVWCGEKWNPCPRCCCCCLCPSPTITWSGITTDTTTFFGIPITTSKIETTIPYAGDPPGLGGAGCWWDKVYDPPLEIGNDSVNMSLVLYEISLIASTINPSPTPCSTVYFSIGSTELGNPTVPLGGFSCVLAYPTRLWCCSPHHLSSSDTIDFAIDNFSSSCGWDDDPLTGLTDAGTVKIECPNDSGGTEIDTDCQPIV